MRFRVTPLGGAGAPVSAVVEAIVRYLNGPRHSPGAPGAGGPDHQAGSADRTHAGPARYYAEGSEGPGRWLGGGAASLGLVGEVAPADFARVLAGRHPRTDERLVTARGSAGRRPRLGAGAHSRVGPDGQRLYGLEDAAVTLGVTVAETSRLVAVGRDLANLPPQPPGSYLVPVTVDGRTWVSEDELERCESARTVGTTPGEVTAAGPAEEALPLAEAARLAGVTRQYLRRLARRYETDRASIDAAVAEGRSPRSANVVAHRGSRDEWLVRRDRLAEFLERRRPPAVRVGFDLTLTTEKSLGVLALLSPATTRDAVLDAIEAGNDHALAWLERHAAAARSGGRVVPVRGWTVASFRHHTSRALDPFPHHHNVVANSAAGHDGQRRTLDARLLYRHAQAASALATAEMRHRLTHRLGVRWRRGRTSWEVAGIPDAVLDEFSRRRSEIDDALREIEEAIGRRASFDLRDDVILRTRAAKVSALVDDLVDGWWARANALGFGRDHLAACAQGSAHMRRPDADAVFAALAAHGGVCENTSVFDRGDVLHALVTMADPSPDSGDGEEQPLVVPADEVEALADGFLASGHVEQLTGGGSTNPARYTTKEMLAVQERIVRRYVAGLRRGAAVVGPDAVGATLRRHPRLTGEQHRLVTAFCTSGHRIQCAVGRPGAGKTTSMAAARDAWEAIGFRVLGAAVKGEAARTLGKATGMPTETVAWYLAHDDPLDSPLDARAVLVVDEASTLSDRDLDRLGWLADATGATLRLVGDPAQHGAVEAGGMFRVLCERHPQHTPELTASHRLQDPHDRAAADALRAGDVAEALRQLDEAGHLHVVEDELAAYTHVLARWWTAHLAGHEHPMVDRRNSVRRTLNRLAHALRRAHGELGPNHLSASDDRRFAVGDRVIARAPDRTLHPPGDKPAYVRNGATGTLTAIHHGDTPDADTLTVEFDDIAAIEVPRRYFDGDESGGVRRAGLEHAYAVTSWAVQGATNAVSTSRVDESSTRAEAYVDITRGRHANHLYVTRRPDPLDGEALPRVPPDPADDTVATRLRTSTGERTAWEIRNPPRSEPPGRSTAAGLGL